MKPALQFLQSELGVDPPTLPSLVGISSYRPGVGVASKGWSRHWLLEMSFVRACLLRLSAGLGADPLLGSAHVDSGVQTPPQSVFFVEASPSDSPTRSRCRSTHGTESSWSQLVATVYRGPLGE